MVSKKSKLRPMFIVMSLLVALSPRCNASGTLLLKKSGLYFLERVQDNILVSAGYDKGVSVIYIVQIEPFSILKTLALPGEKILGASYDKTNFLLSSDGVAYLFDNDFKLLTKFNKSGSSPACFISEESFVFFSGDQLMTAKYVSNSLSTKVIATVDSPIPLLCNPARKSVFAFPGDAIMEYSSDGKILSRMQSGPVVTSKIVGPLLVTTDTTVLFFYDLFDNNVNSFEARGRFLYFDLDNKGKIYLSYDMKIEEWSISEKKCLRTYRTPQKLQNIIYIQGENGKGRILTLAASGLTQFPLGVNSVNCDLPESKIQVSEAAARENIRPKSIPVGAKKMEKGWIVEKWKNGKRDGKWEFWYEAGEYGGSIYYEDGRIVRHELLSRHGQRLLPQ